MSLSKLFVAIRAVRGLLEYHSLQIYLGVSLDRAQ